MVSSSCTWAGDPYSHTENRSWFRVAGLTLARCCLLLAQTLLEPAKQYREAQMGRAKNLRARPPYPPSETPPLPASL